MHALGGVWGLFATGFFNNNQGALYKNAYHQGQFMGYQIVGITVIVAWTTVIVLPAFYVLRKLHMLRVDKAIEEVGLDVAELGGVSEEFLDAVREQLKLKGSLETTAAEEEEDEEAYLERKLREEKEAKAQKNKPQNAGLKKELRGEAFIF